MDVNFEIIEKYVYGKLKGKELREFEKLLKLSNEENAYPVNLFTFKKPVNKRKRKKE